MTYAEKLKDPRWQRRRLGVLQRAEFSCENCEAKDKTLHVHHKRYSGEPWESPDEDLECLCEDCHDSITASKKRLLEMLGGLSDESLDTLAGLAWWLGGQEEPIMASTYGLAEGIAAGCRCVNGQQWVTAEFILSNFRDEPVSDGALACVLSHAEEARR